MFGVKVGGGCWNGILGPAILGVAEPAENDGKFVLGVVVGCEGLDVLVGVVPGGNGSWFLQT